jgi:PAS domain S-box-containing protein
MTDLLTQSQAPLSSPQNSRLTILLVDDNPQDRRLVVRELRKSFLDAEIVEAVDQQQLDGYLSSYSFDVVVTDYHLHWSNGIQVLQAVKSRNPLCPVIMFTGTGNEEVAVEAMKHGLDDYIIKNVKHLVRLCASVQVALEHASTRLRAEQLATRLESLLSQLDLGVFSCDGNGRFLEVNDAMAKFLNCTSQSASLNSTLADLFTDPRDCALLLERASQSGTPVECEIEHLTNSGESGFYRLNVTAVCTKGMVTRIDGLMEDVTRRKESEAQAKSVAVAIAQIKMLSPREREVLQGVVAGMANKVIARRMEISEKTVEKHRGNLMKKLHVRSVPDLVRLALLAGHFAPE